MTPPGRTRPAAGLAAGTALAALAALVSTLSACGSDAAVHPTGGTGGTVRTAAFDDSGVTVSVRYDPAAPATLAVTFTPDKPGFHLYSLDMPDGGVQGLGAPLRVSTTGALTPAGPPRADHPTSLLQIAGLDVRLPVYPDGAVTVTLPVKQAGGQDAVVSVSYAACSPTTCLPPVEKHPMTLHI